MISGNLDSWFCATAIQRGLDRAEVSRAAELTSISHSGGVSGSFDSYSAIGEHVVALYWRLPLPALQGTFKIRPDVGPLEVQSVLIGPATKGRNLLMRATDGEALVRPYVLVHIHTPDGDPHRATHFEMPGWMTGTEAQMVGTNSWWDIDLANPCKVVDYHLLHPFDSVWDTWLDDWKRLHASA